MRGLEGASARAKCSGPGRGAKRCQHWISSYLILEKVAHGPRIQLNMCTRMCDLSVENLKLSASHWLERQKRKARQRTHFFFLSFSCFSFFSFALSLSSF